MSSDPCAWFSKDAPAMMNELPATLSELVATLPPRFAAVIRLVDLEEQSYKDAALTLGVPMGTIMSRLHRARRLLAAHVDSSAREPARAA
jgi:RNA polymerase sigma-70 factor (ECF subfamily)